MGAGTCVTSEALIPLSSCGLLLADYGKKGEDKPFRRITCHALRLWTVRLHTSKDGDVAQCLSARLIGMILMILPQGKIKHRQ